MSVEAETKYALRIPALISGRQMDARTSTVSIFLVAITKDNPCDSQEAESQGFPLRLYFYLKSVLERKQKIYRSKRINDRKQIGVLAEREYVVMMDFRWIQCQFD